MKGMLVGGSAAPRAMIAGFKERHGLNVVHGWGMTETSPVASVTRLHGRPRGAPTRTTQFDYVAMAGHAAPARRAARARRPTATSFRGTASRWASSRSAARGSRRRTTTTPEHAGPLDGRRLVQDRRHRLDPPARLHPDQGPLEGRDQVRRRVDLVGRARERADGASGRRRGGGDRDAATRSGPSGRSPSSCCKEGAERDGGASCASSSRRSSRSGGCPTASSSSTRSRRRRSASSRRPRCASSSRRDREAPGTPVATQLRAVLLRETGGPEQLELAEVDEPEPGGRAGARARARRGDQLPRRARAAGPLPADARAADRARRRRSRARSTGGA